MPVSPVQQETHTEEGMHTISWLTDSPISVEAYPSTAREGSQDVPAQPRPLKPEPVLCNTSRGRGRASVSQQKPNCQYQVSQQEQCKDYLRTQLT